MAICGSDIHEMVSSYLSDAITFGQKSDRVNQYASLSYAHGWLDAGYYLGFFDQDRTNSPEMISNEEIENDKSAHLHEKTLRYQRMLSEAIVSVKPAPERGSPLRRAAEYILRSVGDELKKGDELLRDGRKPAALGRYSYGYGWLDAALRSGLFTVIAHPELFTTE